MRPFTALLRTLTWASLASIALPRVLDAQAVGSTKAPGDSTLPAYRFRLLGVFDDATGKPVEGVQVIDVLSGTSTMTPKSGTVSLFFLPDGGSMVRLRKLGYEEQTFMVPIAPADTTPLTISMVHATVLPTVVTRDSAEHYLSPALRGFEQRRAEGGFGSFIDEAEMRKDDDWTLANVLTSHFPGIMPTVSPTGEEYITSTRKMCAGGALAMCRGSNCYPSVYVDGVRYSATGPAGINAIDFGDWDPRDFAAAEFYSSLDVPEEFGGPNAECGVLLLWTREH